MAGKLHQLIPSVDAEEIGRRLQRLAAIRDRRYQMEVLTNFPYEEVAQIFVRVNSGGRALSLGPPTWLSPLCPLAGVSDSPGVASL